MAIDIIGISGSPVRNSNTDRLVQAVLEASGLETEFVKLSNISVAPCRACKRCVEDNVCKVKDDFPALAEKVKSARAMVIGSYCPYSSLDGFTKAFMERLWSMRHQTNLNRGKLIVTAVTGLMPQIIEQVSQMLAMEIMIERMELVGQLHVSGNVPCLTCGKGDVCEMSGASVLFGPDAKISAELCVAVEDQKEVWDKALQLGQTIGKRLRSGRQVSVN
ncbi:MAG: flavodoxin family protein [Deltaproteobacteria bacterium]|nr:flavodoxin family protein [Deltaproteobacteria bacterium]MBW1813076.1 flavodoxin family protein [Deltaproteobacteria bacterium]MBW1983977.1 flavodoxin family protein [Deltaproteobacteria bacterium]MBW2181095.1 flavodoxin family protein [Deltaproteobacteria bacterium]MBW2363952.1 flavodoxin family protein [Deltaproteobacteria bacterium]